MDSWIRDDIRTMESSFSGGDPPAGTIRLDAMESPFLLSDEIREGLSVKLSSIPLNRYPDHTATELVGALSRLWSVPADQILLGNGSDEILLNLFLATKGPVICPVPSFSMYEVIARTAGKPFIPVDLKSDLTLDLEMLASVVSQQDLPGILVVSSPNNPTGGVLSPKEIGHLFQVARARGFALLVDEAYFPYHGGSVLGTAFGEGDLLILRTFSKMGMAALRLGVLLAPERVVREIGKIRLPYNLNALTQEAALFLIREHLPDLEGHVQRIVSLREKMARDLSLIPGIRVFPSWTNFLLVRFWRGTGSAVFSDLLGKGILVRDVSFQHPFLGDCLRISVGSPGENEQLVNGLRHFSERVRS